MQKIFKALGVGLKSVIVRNLEIVYFGIVFLVIALAGRIMKIFNIIPKGETEIEIMVFSIFAIFIGIPCIIIFVLHAIVAVRYSDEMKCTMEEAWKATAIELDEDF